MKTEAEAAFDAWWGSLSKLDGLGTKRVFKAGFAAGRLHNAQRVTDAEAEQNLRDYIHNAQKRSWYCDQCHVEVYERRCPHCGKLDRDPSENAQIRAVEFDRIRALLTTYAARLQAPGDDSPGPHLIAYAMLQAVEMLDLLAHKPPENDSEQESVFVVCEFCGGTGMANLSDTCRECNGLKFMPAGTRAVRKPPASDNAQIRTPLEAEMLAALEAVWSIMAFGSAEPDEQEAEHNRKVKHQVAVAIQSARVRKPPVSEPQSGSTVIPNIAKLLRDELKASRCPAGGWIGQPEGMEPTVENCMKYGSCGCSAGDAVKASSIRTEK